MFSVSNPVHKQDRERGAKGLIFDGQDTVTARRKGWKVDGEKEKWSGLLAQIIFCFAHSNHQQCRLRSLRSVVCQNFLHQHKTFQKCLSFLPLDMIKCFFPRVVKKVLSLYKKWQLHPGATAKVNDKQRTMNTGQRVAYTSPLSLYVFLSLFPLFFLILSIVDFHFCKWVIL